MLENEIRDKVAEGHEGKRKTEALWPVHQINWQRSRYVFDMHYKYKKIDKETYEYCVRNKLVDAALIAKWKKPGYERLCTTYVINTRNYKFGTTSICRVPAHALGPDASVEDPTSGCRGCASGPGGQRNIFGNKYGQYLAAIQVAREEERTRREEIKKLKVADSGGAGKTPKSAAADGVDGDDGAEGDVDEEDDDDDEDEDRDAGIWAKNSRESELETVESKGGGENGKSSVGSSGSSSSSSSSSSATAVDEPDAKRPRH